MHGKKSIYIFCIAFIYFISTINNKYCVENLGWDFWSVLSKLEQGSILVWSHDKQKNLMYIVHTANCKFSQEYISNNKWISGQKSD